ncbi:hypothetical protein [Streptomyces drozdowiczii]|uniref:hypothetical protein n=1 Tax=Streptomyces drozdowiczii TaxID=202862 RepID=UPI0031ECEF1E
MPLVVMEVKSPTAKSGWSGAAREINEVYATRVPVVLHPQRLRHRLRRAEAAIRCRPCAPPFVAAVPVHGCR